jgi:uncharacterized protein (TIGR02996 family)
VTDEAFIRAIVDRPGDDLPRLAYADWLDERDDPRGAYLRAEREAVVTDDSSRMRGPAAGLDPVWVARVSRPPLGVCCGHLLLSDMGERVQPDQLDEAADLLEVTLPPELRALLLNYSLGQLRGGPFVMPGERGERATAVDGFVCTTDPDLTDGRVSYELADRTVWLREEYGLDNEFVFLAGTYYDTEYVVSCHPSRLGTVYAMDGYRAYHDPESAVARVAASVGEFLAMLRPRPWPLTNEQLASETPRE